MSAYQQKWVELLQTANLPKWQVTPIDEDDVYIDMPSVTDLKVIRDNLPEILGAMSLDINLPTSRVKFIFHNRFETFEYILNPDEEDLNKA